MGTGSYGGGGSGSGGSGNAGSSGGRYGTWGGGKWKGYHFKNKKLIVRPPNRRKIRTRVKEKLNRVTNQYLDNQFGSKLTSGVYQELFGVAEFVSQPNLCTELAEKYKIDPGPSFLLMLVNAIIENYRHLEYNVKVQETVRTSLEDFFITALGDDLAAIDLYITGTGSQILASLKKETFGSTSGFFLSKMLWRVLEREMERQPEETQNLYREISENIANEVIESFEAIFLPKGKSHRDFFTTIQEDPDWFRRELRK